MKKMLLPIMAVVLGLLTAHAQDRRIEISAGHFRKISFGDNMKVVLKPAETGDAQVVFGKDAAEQLNLSISNDVLHISPRKTLQNAVVYVSVNNPDVLTLGNDTDIDTDGILECKELKLYVNNGVKARLRTRASIKAYPLGDFDVSVRSKTLVPDLSAGKR